MKRTQQIIELSDGQFVPMLGIEGVKVSLTISDGTREVGVHDVNSGQREFARLIEKAADYSVEFDKLNGKARVNSKRPRRRIQK